MQYCDVESVATPTVVTYLFRAMLITKTIPVPDEIRTTESVCSRPSVDGRTVVVPGASSGIGRAITETFVADGADVVICSHTQEDVDAVADELNEAGLPGSRSPGRV